MIQMRAWIRSASVCIVLVFALMAPAGAAVGGADEEHDRWYVLRMQDKRAGWLHDARTVKGDRVVTNSTIHLELKRGTQAVKVGIEAEFVETVAGEPVSMKLVQRLGSEPTVERYTFRKELIQVVRIVGGVERRSERPLPEGKWLTPAAASQFVRQRLEAGAGEVVVRAVDPTSGVDPVMYTNTVEERTHAEALGKTVPAVKWRVTTDRHPDVTTTEYVDERGVPIRSETSLGGLKIEMVLADRELAMSELEAPELLVSTLVKPDKRIDRPRAARRGAYVLSVPGGKLPGLPSSGVQRVEDAGAGKMRVTVDLAAGGSDGQGEKPNAAQREASGMITSDDAKVKALATQAAGGGGDSGLKAERMRRFVHGHIRRKSLGVGFASAAEVAQTRAGDCTEHAVLLAAMLRAEGIASRVVSGVVYAEEFEGEKEIFGYHMWTQAWIERGSGEGAWVDLDATLPGEAAFDATHIALATADFEDGATTNALVSLAPVLGKLRIAVERVEY